VTERLGIFGGTFDPPHVGHLAAARAALVGAGLDRVMFVPAGSPWQKQDRDLSPAEDRYRMTQLAIEGEPGFSVSRIEIDRPGPSYMVDTLETLTSDGRELVLILGADAAAGLPTWRDPERICSLAELAIVTRIGSPAAAPMPSCRVTTVEMEPVDVSATEVRRRATAGEPLSGLVPDAVAADIRRRGLYANR